MLAVIALGHGGGVPNGTAGNTNYAIVPDFPDRYLLTRPEPMEVLRDHPFWLVDCGPETMLRICGCLGGPSVTHNLQGIFLTHLHADHAGGIPSLAWRMRFLDKRRPFLVMPSEMLGLLNRQAIEARYDLPGAPERGLAGAFQQKLLAFDNLSFALPDTKVVVTAFPVDHGLEWVQQRLPRKFPAYGYRITSDEGRTIVISGDTAKPLSLDVIGDADAVLHDCQFYDASTKAVHCHYDALEAALPKDVRRRTWLAHTGMEPPARAYEAGFRWARQNYVVAV